MDVAWWRLNGYGTPSLAEAERPGKQEAVRTGCLMGDIETNGTSWEICLFALGIHGQWLYVNPKAETVIAKFSSQPEPINNPLKHLNLALFAALSTMV